MRRPQKVLKKCCYLTLAGILLLILGSNLRDFEEWKFQSWQHAPQTTQQINSENIHANTAAVSRKSPTDPVGYNDTHQHLKIVSDSKDSGQQPQDEIDTAPTSRPWFFKGGKYYPTSATIRRMNRGNKRDSQGACLFPHQDRHSDRIWNQLMFVPPNYQKLRESGKLKSILLYNGVDDWSFRGVLGSFFDPSRTFLNQKCPVDTCELTTNRDRASTADMIVYRDQFEQTDVPQKNNSKQVTMLYYLECPYFTPDVGLLDAINWTATYRRDSDIVDPYGKWVYYNFSQQQIKQNRNYALNKTKKVVWFVSNCLAVNERLQYAKELQTFIEVDIYGACGNYKCARSIADNCFDMLDHDYKFYLAFENSNCKDYITEKFFVNALQRNILPIVMGARPEDYEMNAPHHSYIHVEEFASPQELAKYLHKLDKDDELYNSYFKWKGTGEFINTHFWCRVCAALHDEDSLREPRWYADVDHWWSAPDVCTDFPWRSSEASNQRISFSGRAHAIPPKLIFILLITSLN